MQSDLIRLAICDDHLLIREGLKSLLARDPSIHVIGDFVTAEAVMERVADLLPDVLIMDVVLPGIDGIEATRMIKTAHPSIAVVILTRYDDTDHILQIYRAGASAYLTKGVDAEELLTTIHAVAGGSVVLHPQVAEEVIRAFASVGNDLLGDRDPPAIAGAGLSPRELEVLRLVAVGHTNKEIARDLCISVRTAQHHLANIFRKLEINDRISAAILAIEAGVALRSDVASNVSAGLAWGEPPRAWPRNVSSGQIAAIDDERRPRHEGRLIGG
jgi:NarL family two-component system response regulator LiaR